MAVTIDHEHMSDVVRRYVAAFEQQDLDAIVDLYAADGTVEDPVGSDVVRGSAAIREFYSQALATGARLRLDGSICSAGNVAAFPFSIGLDADGTRRLHIIDVFEFDADGKIAEMRAIWSASTMDPEPAG